ncbi:MAG: hypothetical protein J6B59_03615 [Alistipes sp.]|nr:hypothetical protein [Alistipes sp.]
MDKNMLCEALYALPSGVIVRRKKSFVMPAIVLVAGLALVTIYYLKLDAMSNNLSSSLILIAGGTLLIGLLMVANRLFDREGCPALAATGEKLRYVERYFPLERRAEIQRYIDEGALNRLFMASEGEVSGISVAIYHSADRKFAAMQAYEYIGFEYRPITGVKVIGGN